MSHYNKIEKEKEVVEFFIKNFKEDVLTEEVEDREADLILIFPDRKIKVQIVSCDHEAIPSIVESKKHKGQIYDINRNRVESIDFQIKQKSKHYDQTLIKEMFLLIHSENISMNKDFIIEKLKDTCDQSKYKSIYFIRLPDNDQKTTYPKNNWDLIKLK